MIKGVVALYTSDVRYADAFLNYNLRTEKEKIIVKVYTDYEEFIMAVGQEAFDLLLIDAVCLDENIENMPYKKAVLSREKFITRQDYDYPAVYMYQKAVLVFKQIYEIISEKTVGDRFCCAAVSAMPKIIGVFSPCYPLLSSQFARSMAKYIGTYKKVLYLNMAKFTEFESGEDKGLSELLYFIQQQGKSMIYKLTAMVTSVDGYDILPGVHHYRDIDDISIKDIEALMKQFELIDEYDVVVIDIGMMGATAYCLMKYCREIWMPVNRNIGYDRQKHMMNDMKKEKRNDIWERIKEIDLSFAWIEREEVKDVWMKEHVNIRV